MSVEEILALVEIPTEYRCLSVSDTEAAFMHDLVQHNALGKTLEIGLACGVSAACIMSAHDGRHTVMDPNQSKEFGNIGLRNIEAIGCRDRLDFHEDYSRSVLPKLCDRCESQYDFAFVDGNHRFDDMFVDFYYVDHLLVDGGYVAFHDTWMRSTQMVASWVRRNRKNYRQLKTPERNLVIFQKRSNDERSWDHFREFYTLRSILSHRIITWLSRKA